MIINCRNPLQYSSEPAFCSGNLYVWVKTGSLRSLLTRFHSCNTDVTILRTLNNQKVIQDVRYECLAGRVARCQVLNRTVRFWGNLSGWKFQLEPDTGTQINTYAYRSRPSVFGFRTELGNRLKVSGFLTCRLATLLAGPFETESWSSVCAAEDNLDVLSFDVSGSLCRTKTLCSKTKSTVENSTTYHAS